MKEFIEDVECGDGPEGVPGGGRREVGEAVLTIVGQTRKKTCFWTLRWRRLGAVPGDGGVWRQRLTGQEYRGKWGYGTGVDQCLELMGMVTTVYAGRVIQEGQAIEGGGVGGEEGR